MPDKELRLSRVFGDITQAYKDGKRGILLQGGTSSTKCLGRGTKIIMHDLTLKLVEDIVVGDKLMGIDGKARNVLKLYRGVDDLYNIKQKRGIDYIVTGNHVLSVRENWRELRVNIPDPNAKSKQRKKYVGHENNYEVTNIPLSEYVLKSKKWKRRNKGWKQAGVELPEHGVLIEPYFIGLWLGDGTKGDTNITNADSEIIDYLKWFAVRNDLRYSKLRDTYGHGLYKTHGNQNPLRQALRYYQILDNKRIPAQYMNNSRQIRLELLAGLVDSDGCATGRNTLRITQKSKDLANDIALLTRSLGFYTTVNEFTARMKRDDGSVYESLGYGIEFVGDNMADIPVKLERKHIVNKPLPRRMVSGFDVEPLGKGEYFGFELDGDRLFLLEDFTVTHNTWSALQFLHLVAEASSEPLVISISSESLPHLKLGCIRDFFRVIDAPQDNNPQWSKTDFIYRYSNKSVVEFWGADNEGKARGPRRHIWFINEGNHVPWSTVESGEVRTSKFIIVDWNPSEEFWVHEYESGGQLVPGWIHDDRFAYSKSTYLDAKGVLPESVVESIESRRDKDPNWWLIYGLGELGSIEGRVHPLFEQVKSLPLGAVVYGLDFGYGGDPAALVKNVIVGDKLYSHQLIYEKNLTNDDIARKMDLLGVGKTELIIADSAEPKSIEEIRRKNFNIQPAPKGPGSLEYGIQKVNQYYQYWTEDSLDAIREQRNYTFQKDRLSGKYKDEPIDDFNHCMDARRYAVTGFRLGTSMGLPSASSNRGMANMSLRR